MPGRVAVGGRADEQVGQTGKTSSTATPKDKFTGGWEQGPGPSGPELSPSAAAPAQTFPPWPCSLAHCKVTSPSLSPLLPSCLPTATLTPAGLPRPCPTRGKGHRAAWPGQLWEEQRMETEGRERGVHLWQGAQRRWQAWPGQAGQGREQKRWGCVCVGGQSSLGSGFFPQSFASATIDQGENGLGARGLQREGTAPVSCQGKGLSRRLSPVGTCRGPGRKEGVPQGPFETSLGRGGAGEDR